MAKKKAKKKAGKKACARIGLGSALLTIDGVEGAILQACDFRSEKGKPKISTVIIQGVDFVRMGTVLVIQPRHIETLL